MNRESPTNASIPMDDNDDPLLRLEASIIKLLGLRQKALASKSPGSVMSGCPGARYLDERKQAAAEEGLDVEVVDHLFGKLPHPAPPPPPAVLSDEWFPIPPRRRNRSSDRLCTSLAHRGPVPSTTGPVVVSSSADPRTVRVRTPRAGCGIRSPMHRSGQERRNIESSSVASRCCWNSDVSVRRQLPWRTATGVELWLS